MTCLFAAVAVKLFWSHPGHPPSPYMKSALDCERALCERKRENVCSRSTSRADKIAAALPNVVQRKEQSCDAFCDTRMCTAKMACRVFQERLWLYAATIIVARADKAPGCFMAFIALFCTNAAAAKCHLLNRESPDARISILKTVNFSLYEQ